MRITRLCSPETRGRPLGKGISVPRRSIRLRCIWHHPRDASSLPQSGMVQMLRPICLTSSAPSAGALREQTVIALVLSRTREASPLAHVRIDGEDLRELQHPLERAVRVADRRVLLPAAVRGPDDGLRRAERVDDAAVALDRKSTRLNYSQRQ